MAYPKTILQPMNTSKACRAVVHVCWLGQTLQIVCGHVAMYQCSWYAASWCDCWLSGCTQWRVYVVQITLLNDYCPAVGWYWWHCLARPCICYGYMQPWFPVFPRCYRNRCSHAAILAQSSVTIQEYCNKYTFEYSLVRRILQGCTCLITLLCVATSYSMWSV